jgi:hypothetical protein
MPTAMPSATPLWPPIGWMSPVNAFFASVVGLPSASKAQSGGMSAPFW